MHHISQEWGIHGLEKLKIRVIPSLLPQARRNETLTHGVPVHLYLFYLELLIHSLFRLCVNGSRWKVTLKCEIGLRVIEFNLFDQEAERERTVVIEIIVLISYVQPIYMYFGSPEEVHQEIHERRFLYGFPILLRLLLLILLLLGIGLRFLDLLLQFFSFLLPLGLQGSPFLISLGIAGLFVPILAPDKISYRIFSLIIVGCVTRVVLNTQNISRNRLYYT